MEDIPHEQDPQDGKGEDHGKDEMNDEEFQEVEDKAREQTLVHLNDKIAENLGLLEERKVAENDLAQIQQGLDDGLLCKFFLLHF